MKGTPMRNKVIAFFGILALVLTAYYVFQPQGFVPLFDANLRQLAMTPKEAHCAGTVIALPESKRAEATAICRDDPDNGYSEEVELAAVLGTFCSQVAIEIDSLDYAECLSIMHDMDYWPLYDGGVTNAWSRSAPYPLDVLGSPGNVEGRTGSRELNERE